MKRFLLGFLDIFLPGTNGVEIAKLLKKLNPFIKVIGISGHSMNSKVGEFKVGELVSKGPFDDFFYKPFENKDLLESIAEGFKE